jgi:conjugal transfer pilus assembly protein TraK
MAATLIVTTMAVVAAAYPTSARAEQPVEIRDGDTTILVVSIRDQTRLRVQDGRVVDVFGDVYDAEKNPTGRIVVLKDESAGEIYVKPMAFVDGSGQASKPSPVKLDVKTDRGTVGLLLSPDNVVGDTKTLRVVGGVQRQAARTPLDKGSAHLRVIKALTLAMAAPELGSDLQPQEVANGGKEVALWQEARFVLKRRFQVPGLVGESYELTNTSSARMVIDEREFYREGVVAVGERKLVLEPGDMTPVWIIRSSTAE